MELNFRKANGLDCKIVFDAIQELLDKPLFSYNEFELYWQSLLEGVFGKCDPWVAVFENNVCAYVLANYYPMPRYLGIGVELEEVVTLPSFQRKGVGKMFIEFLILHYGNDKEVRKIAVKTNDHFGSGKLYESLFGITDMRYYHHYLNKL